MGFKDEEIAEWFIGAIPHSRALGLSLVAIGDGTCEIAMPYGEHLIGDPATGVIHGGAVSALMDTCSAASVMAHSVRPEATVTLDLRIDYMRSAAPGRTVTAKAKCYHVTRSVAFVRAEATDGEGGDPVATATGAFTIRRDG